MPVYITGDKNFESIQSINPNSDEHSEQKPLSTPVQAKHIKNPGNYDYFLYYVVWQAVN